MLSALCVNISTVTVYCCGFNNCNTPNTEVINSQVTSCYVGASATGVGSVTPVQTACPNTGSNKCAVNFLSLYLYNYYIYLY
jgi:hypothetical protein